VVFLAARPSGGECCGPLTGNWPTGSELGHMICPHTPLDQLFLQGARRLCAGFAEDVGAYALSP
jgi:hypothetical protein